MWHFQPFRYIGCSTLSCLNKYISCLTWKLTLCKKFQKTSLISRKFQQTFPNFQKMRAHLYEFAAQDVEILSGVESSLSLTLTDLDEQNKGLREWILIFTIFKTKAPSKFLPLSTAVQYFQFKAQFCWELTVCNVLKKLTFVAERAAYSTLSTNKSAQIIISTDQQFSFISLLCNSCSCMIFATSSPSKPLFLHLPFLRLSHKKLSLKLDSVYNWPTHISKVKT